MMHSAAAAEAGASEQPPLPLTPTHNHTENDLLVSLTQLSLQQASTKPLPPTPTARSSASRSTTPNISRNPSSASRTNRVSSPLPPTSSRKPKPAPFSNDQSSTTGPRSPALRRQVSASTLDARSATPTLLRKASMNSLQKANSSAVTMNGGSNSPRSLSRRSSYSQDAGSIGRHSAMGRSPLHHLDGIMDEKPPKPTVTAESIAHEYFTREMATAASSSNNNITLDGAAEEKIEHKMAGETGTVVILHDACYGHRFSRPKTSKVNLMTIVERPERIHASILGIAAAYVKLGERGSEGRYAIKPAKSNHENENEDEETQSTLPKPFNIIKSTRRLPLHETAVTAVHGAKWMEELRLLCLGAEAKLALNGKELVRPVMDRGKGAEEPSKFHEGDLYLCSESLDAMEGALGAVCDGVDAVFSDVGEGGSLASLGGKTKRAFVVVRPPGHHCSASYPSGFCWVNNVHVGIQHAALHHGLTHAAIIDFDLHHGDGSQDITWEHNTRVKSLSKNAPAWKKTSIGYFSIHDINSYPCEWGDVDKVKNASLCIDNAHGQNIWNVHLTPWKTAQEFWALYENKYAILLEKTRLFLKGQTERIVEGGKVKPRAAIFLSAGFDASEHESEGMQRHKVNVPTEFYARLTRDVRRIAEEEGTSVEGRIISVLEGGYSDRALCSGVFSHISGLAGSDPSTHEASIETTGLGAEVARRMGSLSLTPSSSSEHKLPVYDASWWSLPNLEALEAPEAPKPESEASRKPRENGPPATYYASTQSFDAKIVTESPKGRRSSSGLFAHPPPHGYKPAQNIPLQRPRAPTPPPPEVPWAVAAKALCKVLIPTDRQTMSCRPEDLNAAATRERKERQSLTLQSAKEMLITPPQSGPVSPEPTPSIRKSTRERKPARPVDTEAEEAARLAAASRSNRRRTVAGAGVIVTEPSRPTLSARGSTARQVPTTARVSSRRASFASNTDTVMGSMSPPPLPSIHDGPSDTTHSQTQSRTSTRPSTSSSSQAEWAMSSRGVASGVAVRKTRAPPAPIVTAPRASVGGVVARALVGRQGSGGMTAPVPVRRASGAPSAAQLSQAQPTPQAPQAQQAPKIDGLSERRIEHREKSADVEGMTKGMNKVRITLLTKTQREAKEAKAAAEARFDAEANQAAALQDASATQEAMDISANQFATEPHHPHADGGAIEREPKGHMKRESVEGRIALFEGGTPSAVEERLGHAPVPVARPAVVPVGVRGGELPVWSSTGVIPFALTVKKEERLLSEEVKQEKGEVEEKKEKQEMDNSICEVPETPLKN